MAPGRKREYPIRGLRVILEETPHSSSHRDGPVKAKARAVVGYETALSENRMPPNF